MPRKRRKTTKNQTFTNSNEQTVITIDSSDESETENQKNDDIIIVDTFANGSYQIESDFEKREEAKKIKKEESKKQKTQYEKKIIRFRKKLIESKIFPDTALLNLSNFLNRYDDHFLNEKEFKNRDDFFLNSSFPSFRICKDVNDFILSAYKNSFLKYLKNVRMKRLKNAFNKLYDGEEGEFKPTLKEEIIQWIFSKVIGKEAERTKRLLEEKYLAGENIEEELAFFTFRTKDQRGNVNEFEIPFDIINLIMKYYFKQNKRVLNELGLVNSKFYLLCLTLWRKIIVKKTNLFKIPILVLKNVSHVKFFDERNFNVKGYKHLLENIQKNVKTFELLARHKDFRFIKLINRKKEGFVFKNMKTFSICSNHHCLSEFYIGDKIVPNLTKFVIQGNLSLGSQCSSSSKSFYQKIRKLTIKNMPGRNVKGILKFFNEYNNIEQLKVGVSKDFGISFFEGCKFENLKKFAVKIRNVDDCKDVTEFVKGLKNLKSIIISDFGADCNRSSSLKFVEVISIIESIKDTIKEIIIKCKTEEIFHDVKEIGRSWTKKLFINRIGHGMKDLYFEEYKMLERFRLEIYQMGSFQMNIEKEIFLDLNGKDELKNYDFRDKILKEIDEEELIDESQGIHNHAEEIGFLGGIIGDLMLFERLMGPRHNRMVFDDDDDDDYESESEGGCIIQ